MTKKLTTEEFVKRSKKIHKLNYNYSCTNYINSKTKVKIICFKHGVFEQAPMSHLNGNGCKKCINELKILSNQRIINDANKIFNYKYKYQNIEYINNNHILTILCENHSQPFIFKKNRINHIHHKSGCPKCVKQNKLTNIDVFINKSNFVHNNKYGYNKITQINSKIKVPIQCYNHKQPYIFYQNIYKHLNGNGCPKCFGRKKTTKEVVKQANKIHNNKYNYSKFYYEKSQKKATIICNNHDVVFEWKQTPKDHLAGYGCPKCAKNTLKTTKEFIKDAQIVHGDQYDYSKTKYIRSNKKIIILCHNHDSIFEFKQTPNDHLSNKNGCPRCRKNISNPEVKWLNSLNILKENRQVKLNKLNKRYSVDGYDPKTNTVYEFYGDYWHANPKKYDMNKTHIKRDKSGKRMTFGKVYNKTLLRENEIKQAGYNLIVMWESDFYE